MTGSDALDRSAELVGWGVGDPLAIQLEDADPARSQIPVGGGREEVDEVVGACWNGRPGPLGNGGSGANQINGLADR